MLSSALLPSGCVVWRWKGFTTWLLMIDIVGPLKVDMLHFVLFILFEIVIVASWSFGYLFSTWKCFVFGWSLDYNCPSCVFVWVLYIFIYLFIFFFFFASRWVLSPTRMSSSLIKWDKVFFLYALENSLVWSLQMSLCTPV